jgi:hypothetical protein
MAITNMKTILRSSFCVVSLVLALAACTAPVGKSPEAASVKATVAAPEVEVVDNFEGDGMEIPLDGSSVEAFDASLALVKKHSSENNYALLQKALSYMMAFDVSVRNNRSRMASRLNGLNGYEVIDQVDWRKPPMGKSSVEKKGAADTKTFDT